jgi:phosphatidyl-myo-inositol dimannoside synthase
LAAEYEQTDVVVLLSRFKAGSATMGEGLGLALLEASAAGVPVIGAEVGGSMDAVIDGTTGYLVPAGDDRQLMDVLTRLAREPELRMRLGEAGKRWVEYQHSPAAFDARVVDAVRAASNG